MSANPTLAVGLPRPTTPSHATRIPALDGVRGIAILLVLLSHLTQYGFDLPEHGLPRVVFKLAQSGWVGVDLFFVLSGFLITSILLRTRGGPQYFRQFYVRRTRRIVPLYVVTLGVATLVMPMAWPSSVRLRGWVDQAPWLWTYTANIELAWTGWHRPEVQGLDHFWSLAVEEQFYLLWPIAVWALTRRSLWRVSMAIMAGSLVFRLAMHVGGYPLAGYVLMPARMDALCAGAIVAMLANRPEGVEPVARGAWRASALLAAGLVAIIGWRRRVDPEEILNQTIGFTLLAGLFASLLVIALTSHATQVGRVLRSSALRFFGKYSYALYVVHHPLLFLLPPRVLAAPLEAALGSPLLARAVAVTGVAAVSVGAAMTSWHVLEKHFLVSDGGPGASAIAQREVPAIPCEARSLPPSAGGQD